ACDERVCGDAARAEILPVRCAGSRQIGDRIGRIRRSELLGSPDPLLRVGPVVVVFLGTTIMDTDRFRLATLTQFAKRGFEQVSMERPEVADRWFCVASGCFYRDEGHCRRRNEERARDGDARSAYRGC